MGPYLWRGQAEGFGRTPTTPWLNGAGVDQDHLPAESPSEAWRPARLHKPLPHAKLFWFLSFKFYYDLDNMITLVLTFVVLRSWRNSTVDEAPPLDVADQVLLRASHIMPWALLEAIFECRGRSNSLISLYDTTKQKIKKNKNYGFDINLLHLQRLHTYAHAPPALLGNPR